MRPAPLSLVRFFIASVLQPAFCVRPPRPRCLPMAALVLTLALTLVALGSLGTAPARAEPPQLTHSPVDCRIGPEQRCYIQQYMDVDPGPGFMDYQCGTLSYDDSTGLDIAVRSMADMRRGVTVYAAASGVVRAIRDGVADVYATRAVLKALNGKFAGNSVVLTHDDGWETQYAHLLKGSVRVKPGQRVEAGTPLGLIGLSGRTHFPHVEMVVRHQGKPVSPFLGAKAGEACGFGGRPLHGRSLWAPGVERQLAYRDSGVVLAGFAPEAAKRKRVLEDGYEGAAINRSSPVLAFFVEFYGPKRGDVPSLRLIKPDGSVAAESAKPMPKDRARQFLFVGIRRPGNAFPPGSYRGEFQLRRNGHVVASTVREIRLR